MRCEEQFVSLYKAEPEKRIFCPYRVCPLGAHIDHQQGLVTGFALDRGIHLAYRRRTDTTVRLASLDFPGAKAFDMAALPAKVGDWADHLRGAVMVLSEVAPLSCGIDGVFEGTLAAGGISSSAAVILVFMAALCQVNGISLSDREKIDLARAAENRYVGVACGKLDQSCEVLCRRDRLLLLDNLDDSYENIPSPVGMKPYKIGIFYSGLDRSLANSRYNLRVDECRAAAFSLLAYGELEYGKFNEVTLRQVPEEIYNGYVDNLPKPLWKRAEHYHWEMDRVKKGVAAWREGNLDAFGGLMFASGQSSIENYECGCPELTNLFITLRQTKGVYGARFSGAGFKGCVMALVNPAYEEEIRRTVTDAYGKTYPALAERFSVTYCDTADGITAF